MTEPAEARRPAPEGRRAANNTRGTGCRPDELTFDGARVEYATAGAAQRQATSRAIAAGATGLDLRVLLAVLDRTTSYSKLHDRRTSITDIARIAYGYGAASDTTPKGDEMRNVRRALHRLAEAGALVYDARTGRNRSRVAVPMPEPVPDGGDYADGKGGHADPLSPDDDDGKGGSRRPERGVAPTPKGGSPHPPNREVPREGTPEVARARARGGQGDSDLDTFGHALDPALRKALDDKTLARRTRDLIRATDRDPADVAAALSLDLSDNIRNVHGYYRARLDDATAWLSEYDRHEAERRQAAQESVRRQVFGAVERGLAEHGDLYRAITDAPEDCPRHLDADLVAASQDEAWTVYGDPITKAEDIA